MRSTRFVAHVAAVLLLAGCFSTGEKRILDTELLNCIEPGKTTKDQVLKLLGKPQITRRTIGAAQSVEVWHYSYGTYKTNPGAFIPVVGLFSKQTEYELHGLSIRFDESGLVKDVEQEEEERP